MKNKNYLELKDVIYQILNKTLFYLYLKDYL